MKTPSVLVTDPEQRAALAALRSLGRGGYRVFTIGRSVGLAGRSRFAAGSSVVSPGAEKNAEAMLAAVAASVKKFDVEVVIPVTDSASRLLLGLDDRVGARVAGPTRDAYLRASDKRGLLELAARCGIRTPRQVLLEQPEDSVTTAIPFETLVVKPARSAIEVDGRLIGTQVTFVDDHACLRRTLDNYPREAYPLLLQERTVGQGIGVFLFRSSGVTRLVFGHRRLRERPPAGGVSTYRESIVPPPPLVEACERLLDCLHYEGAAMVEFKEDQQTGEMVLMEINARLWGSLQLAIDAGVDFPRALVQHAMGHPIVTAGDYVSGLRSVWELGELDHILALLLKSREVLHLPQSQPVGIRGVLAALGYRSTADRPEVFDWRDPAPFFVELGRWIRRTA